MIDEINSILFKKKLFAGQPTSTPLELELLAGTSAKSNRGCDRSSVEMWQAGFELRTITRKIISSLGLTFPCQLIAYTP